MGLRDIWIKIKGRDDSGPALKSANRNVLSLGKNAKALGGFFKGSFGLAIRSVKMLAVGITGLVATSAGVVKVGYNFRKSMALVNTMLPVGSTNLKKFGKDIINMSMDIGVAKDQLADGLYQTLSAGVPEDNAISFLATASKAAVGGATDVATAVDALTTVVNSYAAQGITAAQASDVLFATVKQGKTTFTELATQIGQVAGIAANSGISLESMAASIATITKSGIDTRRAITGLRAGILSIVAPSDELSEKLKELGTSGEDLIKTKGVQGAFAEIAKMAGGSQEALKKLIPQVEALPAFLALAGDNAKVAASDLRSIGAALGESAAAYSKMDSVRGWPKLWQSVAGQITKIGVVMDRKLNPLAGKISKAIKKWGESEGFKAIETTMNTALATAEKIATAIGAGGESRKAALAELKGYFEIAMTAGANAASQVLVKAAPLIGAILGTVAKGVISGGFDAITAKQTATKQVRAEMGAEKGLDLDPRSKTIPKELHQDPEFQKRIRETTDEILRTTMENKINGLQAVYGDAGKVGPDLKSMREKFEESRAAGESSITQQAPSKVFSALGSMGMNAGGSVFGGTPTRGTAHIEAALDTIAKATEGTREDLNK